MRSARLLPESAEAKSSAAPEVPLSMRSVAGSVTLPSPVAALTTTDDASGLLIWRAFADRAHTEIARAARYQREIGLVQQIVRPARSAAAGRTARGDVGGAEDPTPEVLRLCVALHSALVRSGLHHG